MTSIVMTIPHQIAGKFDLRIPGITRTATAMSDLFGSARRSLKILMPYIDPTLAGLVAAVRAPVRIVTTPSPGRAPKSNPVLDRCVAMCGVAVRYFAERGFQLHARLVIVDRKRAYVGSANLTDCSFHYNLETGLLIDDRSLTGRLNDVYDYVFDHVAVPGDAL